MSMTHTGSDDDLTADEAFDITLLVNAEMTYRIIMQRNQFLEGHLGKRRRNLLKSLGSIVEAINQTYKGQVPKSFIARAETYYLTSEAAMNTLLKGYKVGWK